MTVRPLLVGVLFLFPFRIFAHAADEKGEDNTAFLFLRQQPPPARPTSTASLAIGQADIPPHASPFANFHIIGVVVFLVVLIGFVLLWRKRTKLRKSGVL